MDTYHCSVCRVVLDTLGVLTNIEVESSGIIPDDLPQRLTMFDGAEPVITEIHGRVFYLLPFKRGLTCVVCQSDINRDEWELRLPPSAKAKITETCPAGKVYARDVLNLLNLRTAYIHNPSKRTDYFDSL